MSGLSGREAVVKRLARAAIGVLFLSTLALVTGGCAHWVGEQSRLAADRSLTFTRLREDPDAYRGKLVLVGGIVVTVTRSQEGAILDVEEHRLDSRELPDQVVPSRGRFLATTAEHLDPAQFKPGALVTMMGEVKGKRVQTTQGGEYSYPLIAVREIHAIELPEIHPEYDYGDRHHFLHVW